MSFAVARMQKVKSGNLVGVGNHNQRNTDNHSNKDIDVERSHLNYDLVNRTENYKRDIEQFINDNKSSSRAVRKDAVLINEWIITSDNPFFKDKDDTLGATVGQAKKLMNNLMSEVKEFVKGGEFEKIHRNETKTRDRDELSR